MKKIIVLISLTIYSYAAECTLAFFEYYQVSSSNFTYVLYTSGTTVTYGVIRASGSNFYCELPAEATYNTNGSTCNEPPTIAGDIITSACGASNFQINISGCPENSTRSDGVCICDGGGAMLDNVCVCPTGEEYIEGVCSAEIDCPTNSSQVGGECVCDTGYHDEAGICVLTLDCGEHGTQVGGECVCEDGYAGSSCYFVGTEDYSAEFNKTVIIPYQYCHTYCFVNNDKRYAVLARKEIVYNPIKVTKSDKNYECKLTSYSTAGIVDYPNISRSFRVDYMINCGVDKLLHNEYIKEKVVVREIGYYTAHSYHLDDVLINYNNVLDYLRSVKDENLINGLEDIVWVYTSGLESIDMLHKRREEEYIESVNNQIIGNVLVDYCGPGNLINCERFDTNVTNKYEYSILTEILEYLENNISQDFESEFNLSDFDNIQTDNNATESNISNYHESEMNLSVFDGFISNTKNIILDDSESAISSIDNPFDEISEIVDDSNKVLSFVITNPLNGNEYIVEITTDFIDEKLNTIFTLIKNIIMIIFLIYLIMSIITFFKDK